MTTKTGNHTEDIAQRIHEAGERLAELKEEVVTSATERVETFGTLVRKHPLAAVGIGIGVGYLLARLVHR